MNRTLKSFLYAAIVIAVIGAAVWSIYFEIGRNYGKADSVTFTVESKKRDWFGSNKDEQSYVVKTKDGKPTR